MRMMMSAMIRMLTRIMMISMMMRMMMRMRRMMMMMMIMMMTVSLSVFQCVWRAGGVQAAGRSVPCVRTEECVTNTTGPACVLLATWASCARMVSTFH